MARALDALSVLACTASALTAAAATPVVSALLAGAIRLARALAAVLRAVIAVFSGLAAVLSAHWAARSAVLCAVIAVFPGLAAVLSAHRTARSAVLRAAHAGLACQVAAVVPTGANALPGVTTLARARIGTPTVTLVPLAATFAVAVRCTVRLALPRAEIALLVPLTVSARTAAVVVATVLPVAVRHTRAAAAVYGAIIAVFGGIARPVAAVRFGNAHPQGVTHFAGLTGTVRGTGTAIFKFMAITVATLPGVIPDTRSAVTCILHGVRIAVIAGHAFVFIDGVVFVSRLDIGYADTALAPLHFVLHLIGKHLFALIRPAERNSRPALFRLRADSSFCAAVTVVVVARLCFFRLAFVRAAVLSIVAASLLCAVCTRPPGSANPVRVTA